MDWNGSYEELYNSFRWQIPEYYNIGVEVCDRPAADRPERPAIIEIDASGQARETSFAELRDQSNRLANFLGSQGVAPGARIGILLQQSRETAISHIAVYKMGAIALPLFMLFGAEALEHRLVDSGARVVITDRQGLGKISSLLPSLPHLKLLICIDDMKTVGRLPMVAGWKEALADQPTDYEPVNTKADDPALLIYTSGTTGLPKGALHAHRVLPGHLPGVEMSHDGLPQPGDRIWTPADWAWIGGLLDVLLPALYHGVPVVAKRFDRFTGEAAFELMASQAVRNVFLPPTALKLMRAVKDPHRRWTLDLRSVASGGEPLGTELLAWGRRVLGVTINEFYGQTECNMIVSSASSIMAGKPGAMGRPVPGHFVSVIDASCKPCTSGVQGDIAVRRPDPVMFLRYWNNEEATGNKFRDDWLLTGDVGVMDDEGYIYFVGRDDDVITSSGYRIGPGEIENCLLGHPAVQMAGVVGKPDPVRTQIVVAFIQLKDGCQPGAALRDDIMEYVRTRLSAHEYPRQIEFVDEMPVTTTGKIVRRELRKRLEERT